MQEVDKTFGRPIQKKIYESGHVTVFQASHDDRPDAKVQEFVNQAYGKIWFNTDVVSGISPIYEWKESLKQQMVNSIKNFTPDRCRSIYIAPDISDKALFLHKVLHTLAQFFLNSEILQFEEFLVLLDLIQQGVLSRPNRNHFPQITILSSDTSTCAEELREQCVKQINYDFNRKMRTLTSCTTVLIQPLELNSDQESYFVGRDRYTGIEVQQMQKIYQEDVDKILKENCK